MPPKPATKRIYRTPAQRGKVAATAARTIQKAVRTYLNRNIETKKSNYTATDGTDIGHNSFINVDPKVLATTQGTSDPVNQATNNRVGDEINLKGVAFKFMLENNSRYPDVNFRIMVIKSAKGDTPTNATLFNGLSGNKMMDTLNNERYTVIFSKYVKVKSPNVGTVTAVGGPAYIGSGLYEGAGASLTLTPGTKIVKFYIPGYKFVGKKGLVRYENQSDQVKFFDYNVVIYAYSTIATSEALGWNVGKLNEYIKIMYYKDA